MTNVDRRSELARTEGRNPPSELARTEGRNPPSEPARTEGRNPRSRRSAIGRLEIPAIRGVLVREFTNFGSYWRSTTFSSTIDPTIYLLAFGFGFGTLVTQVDGHDYVDFVGTGVVASAVLFSSVFPAMFGTFVKYKFQHTYDAILAAPVDTEELVTAEALWMACRAGTFGCVPLLVAIAFGLDPALGMLLVPPIAFISGLGWSLFGIMIAGILKSIDNFNYVTSMVITPMFLVAGTFFPLSGLPEGAQILGNLNPLHHTVELVRHASFGWEPAADLLHLGALLVFAAIMWRFAIRSLGRKLVN